MEWKTKGGNDHQENEANGIKGVDFVSNHDLQQNKADQKIKKFKKNNCVSRSRGSMMTQPGTRILAQVPLWCAALLQEDHDRGPWS